MLSKILNRRHFEILFLNFPKQLEHQHKLIRVFTVRLKTLTGYRSIFPTKRVKFSDRSLVIP